MPRELKIKEENKVMMFDGITGEKFWLTHKTVTSEEMIKYQGACMNIVTSKSKNSTEELIKTQLDWGKKLITSVQPDYFTIEGNPITNTHPGWKEAVSETASDVLIALVKYLFANNSFVISDEAIN